MEAHTNIRYCLYPPHSVGRDKVLRFMDDWGMQWHGCLPPPTTGDIIAAEKNGRIVGTVTFDFRTDQPFPLENIYDFSKLRLYFPEFKREDFVQGGRWFGAEPGVSRMLLHAIAEYCIPRGSLYLLAEVKAHSLKRLEEFGIPFLTLNGVPPKLDSIPTEGLRYYTEVPLPRLMVIRLTSLLIDANLQIL